MSYKRIISLLPSSTEIIYALGAGDLLVGRSHECDYPSEVSLLPVCTSASVDNSMSSKMIDEKVNSSVLNAISIYHTDMDLIKDLQPDLIIIQDQCKVCAVHFDDLREELGKVLGYQPEILSLHPSSLQDILNDIKTIADKAGVDSSEYLEELNDRIDIIRHKVKFVKNRPRIACIEWMEPLMTAGHWTPELISIAGGEPVLSKVHTHSAYISFEALKEEDPDGIIIAPCGFPIERTKEELGVLFSLEGWNELRAVQKGHIFIADGNAYFNRSGPRIVDTLEMVAEILQVNQFYFGMEGTVWEQLPVKSE